ncbi:MAG: 30S ribosomal protein S3 [Bacilli bacterium]|nr:30S ribosomal protein S3 [Bacilli bacterium]
MGQKVNPIGYRLGVNKTWESNWYAPKKDFGSTLNKDIKIRKYISKKLKDAAVASVIIERKKDKCEVTINTAKPGIIIGRGGEDIEALRKDLSKCVGEEVYISIVEVKNPDVVAKLVADNIAAQIENRAPFRSAQKRALRNTMKAGAKGIKTSVSGRLAGAEMARTEGYTEGTVPLHTLRADIDYAHSEADTTYGKIGVKVWIYKGEILPTKNVKKESDKNVDAKKN